MGEEEKEEKTKQEKQWRQLSELSLIDNYLFGLFIQHVKNEDIIKGIVERMLDIKISHIHIKQQQHEILNAPRFHGVKLDAFLEDNEKTIYNIEIQISNTGNIPKRMRYYQSMIDKEQMPSGSTDYNILPKTIIIFVNDFDLFDKGFYRYTFKNICLEDTSLSLNDESIKVVLNTKGTVQNEVKQELVDLLKYFRNSTKETADKVSSKFIKQLDGLLDPIKNNPKFGGEYMSFLEYIDESNRAHEEKGLQRGIEIGEKKGIEIGEKKATNKIIEQMRKSGMPEEQIRSILQI